jgi:hypothetical protein
MSDPSSRGEDKWGDHKAIAFHPGQDATSMVCIRAN